MHLPLLRPYCTRKYPKTQRENACQTDHPQRPFLQPEQPEQQPAKRQRRYHAITTDSDDESSAGLPAANPEQSADPSLSNTF
ncbi:hypothetical protein V6N13_048368 [Hibiscus sabdariffa]|uniref:Uncharacterized protein n=1 Tax=Hibiscus sabdariffa TaxID=183260 RepID=A0ABR2F708_9ROSI